MPARSLTSLLVRQWTVFATCVAVLFASAALVLLFLLEDAFIDRRLVAAGRSLASASPSVAPLPPEFSVYRADQVPLDIHARLPFAEVGEPFEMRRADRRHVHVLLVDTTDGERRAIVYDVTDQLTVSPQLGAGLLLVIGLTALTLLAAAALARAFVGRISRQAANLVGDVQRSPNPQQVRDLAAHQRILELQQLLGMHADLWEAQLSAIENERQVLAYLGHELRTPLQSAQTSLALLAERRDDPAAFERLQRALARLTRASDSALWLATERMPDSSARTRLLPVVERLVEELAPLSAQAGKIVELDIPESLDAEAPAEIAEAILSNLLLNAIQHGAPGPVSVLGGAGALAITNLVRGERERGGFGFGLEIVRRLARRIGWAVEIEERGGTTTTRVRLPPSSGSAGN